MWETRLILLVAVNSSIFNNEMRTNILCCAKQKVDAGENTRNI